MPAISAFGRPRKEDCREVEASLGVRMRVSLENPR